MARTEAHRRRRETSGPPDHRAAGRADDRVDDRAEDRAEDRAAGRYWARSALGLALLLAVALPFLSLLAAVERRSPWLLELDTSAADRLNALANDSGFLLAGSLALTHLGDAATALAAFIVASVVLWTAGSRRPAAFVAATGLGLAVLVPVAKAMVGRERPAVAAPVTDLPGSASFPSGHAMTAVVLAGCLVVVALWRTGLPRWARTAVVAGAVVLSVAVGLTRLTLGVHYVSDVVAGWSLGAAWLAVTTWALLKRDRERPVSPAPSRSGDAGPAGTRSAVATTGALVAAWVAVVVVVLVLGLIVTGPLVAPAAARVDARIAEAIVDARSDTLTELARLGSVPADTAVVAAVTVAAAIALARATRAWGAGLFLVLCVAGASVAHLVVSRTVDRMRPDVPDLTTGLPDAASWPSGHVAAAVALYGALALLLARRLPAVAVAVAVLLVLAVVGTSRVYLSAHDPSDMLAGAALGALWLLVCCRIVRPGPVRPPPTPAAVRGKHRAEDGTGQGTLRRPH